jgi:pyruvate,water dikinase
MRFFEEIRLTDRLREVLDARDDGPSRAQRVEARLKRLILEANIPRDISRAIRRALSRMPKGAKSPALFALRSSAIGEDGDLSFAGLHETCLGVPHSGVLAHYKRALASLFTASAVVYRTRHQEPLEHALMAVGCMNMVTARSSGVAYTLDPNDPARDVLVVSAALGLGKMVVNGGRSIDRFIVSRGPPHRVLSREVSHKSEMYAVDPKEGVRPASVPRALQDFPTVSDEFLAEIAVAALRIERYMKAAQDIEWAQDDNGRLVILQARALQVRADTATVSRQAQAATRRHRVLLADKGTIACRGIGYGRAVVVKGDEKPSTLPKDSVLVAHLSSPHLAELVPQANAVITDVGASTGHLATITREFRVPAIVDVGMATSVLAGGPEITVDAEENVVYEGRVDELLRYQVLKHSSFEDTREFRILRRMLKQISPLNLNDPQAKNFAPRCCESYHDIIRFAHEKAVDYFLEGHGFGSTGKDPNCKTVDMSVPLDLMVIDIGGGLEVQAEDPRCTPEQIRCTPLRALLHGLNSPGAWSTEPADMDFESFMSSATGPSVISASQNGAPRRNLAVVSGHYLNLNLHLGYHFNQVDSYISEVRNDNYIYFRFAGGLTDMARRSRRAKMISDILEKQDFFVDVEEDFVVARLKTFEQETMLERMRMLGLLIGFTRQMDVRMRRDSMIAKGVAEFMEALSNQT